ncbi:MAG: integrase arm-type DNA-binding domain-containing protein, partial [Janthinobacterium sp.]
GDKYPDLYGMYLLVTRTGKYWRLNYRHAGKQKTLALGVYPRVSLAQARRKAEDARKALAEGIDPNAVKRAQKAEQRSAALNTFDKLARQWLLTIQRNGSASTQKKVGNWLEGDVIPYLGKMPLNTIRPRDVLRVVQRVEARGAIDSAHRIKQLCGQVLRFGVAMDLVERDVTADLKGALTPVPRTHYPALTEPGDVAPLLRAIYGYHGHVTAVAALKLAPMLFVRPGELRAAEWSEIHLDAAEWRIPARKMKMQLEHLVPLPTQAVAILRALQPVTGEGRYVFPGLRGGQRCMSENTINAALRSLGYAKEVMTGHGFRAMARTILDEVLQERVDLIEHQLAHSVIDPNGRAYNRTAHLPARRAMMQRWADYLDALRDGVATPPA